MLVCSRPKMDKVDLGRNVRQWEIDMSTASLSGCYNDKGVFTRVFVGLFAGVLWTRGSVCRHSSQEFKLSGTVLFWSIWQLSIMCLPKLKKCHSGNISKCDNLVWLSLGGLKLLETLDPANSERKFRVWNSVVVWGIWVKLHLNCYWNCIVYNYFSNFLWPFCMASVGFPSVLDLPENGKCYIHVV